MNQQEWLEWRRKGIGASDAPIIMGVCPWRKISDLIDEKVYGKEQPDNENMKRGRDLESTALRMFSDKMNVQLTSQEKLVHPKYDWMRATLDGVNYEMKILVEAKCPKKQHASVPEHYYPQLQHQMEVTGFEKGYFISYSDNDLRIFEVQRDDKYIKKLVEREKEFWEALSNLDFSKFEDHEDKSADKNWKELAKEWIELNALLDPVLEKREFLRSQFILFSNGKNAKGHRVKLTRSLVKGAVDYTKIPQLEGMNLEPYRKKSFTKFIINVESG